MTGGMGLSLSLESRDHDGEIVLHIPSRPYAIEQLSCRTLILIIANFNKSANLIFSSPLPPWDNLVVGFLR
jgi:hypothetical protein